MGGIFTPRHLTWERIKVLKQQTNKEVKTTTTMRHNLQKKGKLDKKLPDWGFLVFFAGEMANVGALRVAEQKEKPRRHPPNKDKSQWDRNWVRVLFIHGQPSIKELFPEKHADTETHRRWKKQKKTDTPRQTRGQIQAFFNPPHCTPFSFKFCSKRGLWEPDLLCFFITWKYIYVSA